MSEALRLVMAEFGFDVDLATLEKLNKRVEETVVATKKSTKATDEAAKAQAEASKKAKKDADELGKKLSTYAGILDHLDDVFSESLGKNIAGRFKSVDELAKRFGVTNKGIGKIVVGASAVAVAALATATRAAFAFADAFAADAEALRDTARESRVTTTELQELDHAAVQGGVGVERMRAGLATFGQALRAGERWGNGTTGMLRRLGIQTRDATGRIRPTGEVLNDVSLALERVQNPYRRAAIAQQLFGESGRRMLDVLHSGPGGLMALRSELALLGGGITPEATAASREYTQAQERLKVAQDSLRSVLATSLLPVLGWLVDTGAHVAGMLANLTRGTHVVQIVMMGLGVVGAAVAAALIIAWGPVVAPFLAGAAAVAALVLVFDDLWTFVEGGDSALGRFLDTTFGIGTASQYAHELREEWEAVVGAVEGAIAAVARFTGIETQQAQATLRAPRFGAPTPGAAPARAGAPGAASPTPRGNGVAAPARAGVVAAPATVTIPTTARVAAPGAVSQRTVTRVTHRTSAPTLHFHGLTNDEVVSRVRLELRREDQAQRDADHPQEDDDE